MSHCPLSSISNYGTNTCGVVNFILKIRQSFRNQHSVNTIEIPLLYMSRGLLSWWFFGCSTSVERYLNGLSAETWRKLTLLESPSPSAVTDRVRTHNTSHPLAPDVGSDKLRSQRKVFIKMLCKSDWKYNIYRPIRLYIYVSMYLSIYISICLCIYLSD